MQRLKQGHFVDTSQTQASISLGYAEQRGGQLQAQTAMSTAMTAQSDGA